MKKQQSFVTSPEREDRYIPRQYSTADQLIFGAKALAAIGVVVLILWLLDKSL